MKPEWVLSDHAARRIEDRHDGQPFDPARFRPQPMGVDGLRLWIDADGHGLLVREDSGTGWATFTVVTAYSARMVVDKQESGRFRNLPIPSSVRSLVPHRPQDVSAVAWTVLLYLQGCQERRRGLEIRNALRLTDNETSDAVRVLSSSGLIERATRKTWVISDRGREAAAGRAANQSTALGAVG